MANTQQHEFTLEQTSTLDDLSAWMKIVAIGAMLYGALDIALGGYTATKAFNVSVAMTLIAGAGWLLIGIWLWPAGNAMKSVTMTEGNDITHFMAAITKMQKVYAVQGVLVGLNALLLISVLFL